MANVPIQKLDALTLKHLAIELSPRLENIKIQKVQQPTRTEFLINLWSPATRGQLYFNLNPSLPCVFFIDPKQKQEGEQPDFILSALKTPTNFCMLLRKYLVGGRILRIETLAGERVLNLRIEQENELGQFTPVVLSAELMDKHANLILYQADKNVILGASHPVTSQMSRLREVSAGLPYVPPPLPKGKQLLATLEPQAFISMLSNVDPADYPAVLSQKFQGYGKQMIETVLGERPDAEKTPEKLLTFLRELETGQFLAPGLSKAGSRFTLWHAQASAKVSTEWKAYASLNSLISQYYAGHLHKQQAHTLQQELLQAIQTRMSKCLKREQALTCDTSEDIALLQQKGDLLLTAQACKETAVFAPDRQSVEVQDFETGEPLRIAINPAQSMAENAQRYYQKARKARTRATLYQEQMQGIEAEKAYLQELTLWVGQAEALSELVNLRAEWVEIGLLKADSTPPKKKGHPESSRQAPGILALSVSEDLTIYIGKSSQGNAALVGKLASPHDLWLHVHQMPGSHVLLKTSRKPIPPESLLDAAMLAAHYSSARNSKNIPIIYTEARYVRKIPSSYPGHVSYQQEKSINVTPDISRIEALLAHKLS